MRPSFFKRARSIIRKVCSSPLHVTIIDVECQTGRVWWRINQYCIPVHLSQGGLYCSGLTSELTGGAEQTCR